MLVPVHPRYPGAWASLFPYLDRALQRGDGTRDWGLSDMFKRAEQGFVQLWAWVVDGRIRGAGLTCRTVYPRRAVLEVLAFGADPGHEDGWLQELPVLKDLARGGGMAAIIGAGRPGWARKLGAKERRVFEIDMEAGA